MAVFTSKPAHIASSAHDVYEKLSNLDNLKAMLANVPEDRIPADKLEMFRNLEITSDTITIPGGPVGAIVLRMVDKRPDEEIKLQGEGTPVALTMALKLRPETATSCEAEVEIDIAIPTIMRPMVAGPLQNVVDQFAQVLGSVPFGN